MDKSVQSGNEVETMEGMTPKHRRWNKFIERLEGTGARDFRNAYQEDNAEDWNSLYVRLRNEECSWVCSGYFDIALGVLSEMGELDTEKSCGSFRECRST